MSVFKKLQAARCELQRMPLKKSGNNKFAGYQYFELGDFLPAINDLFAKHGLCGVVSFRADIATLTIHDVEGDGSVTFTSPMGSAALKGCHEVQNIGAVETYQRRYLYVSALEIVEHDALEPVTGAPEPKAKPQPKLVSSADVESIKMAATVAGIDEETICKKGGIKSLNELSADRVSGVMAWLKSLAQGE